MSNETKHTPEPWQANQSELEANSPLCEIRTAPNGDYSICRDASAANARRIVACVNACAGVSSAILEDVNSSERELLHHYVGAIEQRDELVTVLELAQATIERVNPKVHDSCNGTLDVIRAALFMVNHGKS